MVYWLFIMKLINVSCLLLTGCLVSSVFCSLASGQAIVGSWNFNGLEPTTAVAGDGEGPYAAAAGSGSLRIFGPTVGTNFLIGVGQGTTINAHGDTVAGDALRLQRGTRWNNGGIELELDLTGQHTVELSFAAFSSGNSGGNFQVSYRLGDAGSFTDVGSAASLPLDSFELITISLPDAIDQQSEVFLRVTFSDLAGVTSSTGSRVMVDNLSVTAVPEPSHLALVFGLASIALIALRRKKR